MKLQTKLVLLSALFSIIGLTGCRDDSKSCGLLEEECLSLNKVLDEDKCLCIENTVVPVCSPGKHVFGSTCEDDSLLNCGSPGNNCSITMPGWQNGICSNGTCIAINCASGFHLFNQMCEPDSLQNCGSHGKDCGTSIPGWQAGTCLNGACIVTNCASGSHLYNQTCEPDTPQNCGSHSNDCSTSIPGWQAGTCSNGACTVTECASGFHLYNQMCEADSPQNCGNHEANCETNVTNWNAGICIDGQCIVTQCKDGYHLFENVCETDDDKHCGSHEIDCAVSQEGWKTGVCIRGICQVQTCLDNWHLEGGVCVADNAEYCGSEKINCAQTVPGWKTGTCTEGKCQLASCQPGLHLSAGACVADTNDCCGDGCKSCKPNEVCSSGVCSAECSADLVYCSGICANLTSDIHHCGSCSTDCDDNKPLNAKTMNCLENRCAVTSCNDGYLVKGNQCVPCEQVEGWITCNGKCVEQKTDKNHCGVCNHKCGTKQTCGNGICLGNISCGGTTYDTATSINACGDCGNQCADGKICSNGECKDGQGKMYCNGVIVNSLEDSNNCGGCGLKCEQGKKCSSGTCTPYTQSMDATIICNGKNVYPYSDNKNCGLCGNDCGSQKCFNNSCGAYGKNDIIQFGHYEQDSDNFTLSENEPISWRVIHKNSSGEYLLLSEQVLDIKPFGLVVNSGVKWDRSYIRSWLNGYDASENMDTTDCRDDNFFDKAFTDAEKQKIITTKVTADPNKSYKSEQGNDTYDKVFLLSAVEVEQYLNVDPDPYKNSLQCTTTPTIYAMDQALLIYDAKGEMGSVQYYLGKCRTEENCRAAWKLRTMGQTIYFHAIVSYNGYIELFGIQSGYDYEERHAGIRPAIWVKF